VNEVNMDQGAAGRTFPSYEFHVERGKIREFADALGDKNPVYRDPAYAAQRGFANVLAPPTLLRTFLYEPSAAKDALQVKDWSYIVHGEQEFEYFAPIAAGDVLTAQDRIASIEEKDSRRAGKLRIAVIETTFHNQRGEKVQVARRTLVETGKRISDR
jgi:acyl dehydratase